MYVFLLKQRTWILLPLMYKSNFWVFKYVWMCKNVAWIQPKMTKIMKYMIQMSHLDFQHFWQILVRSERRETFVVILLNTWRHHKVKITSFSSPKIHHRVTERVTQLLPNSCNWWGGPSHPVKSEGPLWVTWLNIQSIIMYIGVKDMPGVVTYSIFVIVNKSRKEPKPTTCQSVQYSYSV